MLLLRLYVKEPNLRVSVINPSPATCNKATLIRRRDCAASAHCANVAGG